jgi:hypothetical protein
LLAVSTHCRAGQALTTFMSGSPQLYSERLTLESHQHKQGFNENNCVCNSTAWCKNREIELVDISNADGIWAIQVKT